jgi:hypothetical protein
VLETSPAQRRRMAARARARAMAFDRAAVFDDLFPDTDHERVVATIPR